VPTVVGVDLGTQGARAIVVDAGSGRVVAGATAEYPLLTPQPQWAEQNPDDWWRAARQAIGQALRQASQDGQDGQDSQDSHDR
jgi:xylulokinase